MVVKRKQSESIQKVHAKKPALKKDVKTQDEQNDSMSELSAYDSDKSEVLSSNEETGYEETLDGSEQEMEGPGAERPADKNARFADKINRLLAIPLETGDATKPILAKQKSVERRIDDAKLEARARKSLTVDKQAALDIGRVIPDHETANYEKQLRKIATRGVVQLFNAIRAAQKSVEEVKTERTQANPTEVASISKNAFFDLLQSQGSSKVKISTAPQSKTTEPTTVPWAQDEFMMKPPEPSSLHWDEE